ncbi:MAG: DUF2199 domain-containing protein [Acidobacteriia bacterium]|nr:DUF2199 domain-containing protein [Terriglobia bacterium]
MPELEGFQCHTCGKWHEGLPLDYAYDAPDYWSESLRSDADSFLNADFCVIKNKDFFVRCLIEIPIIGRHEFFRWGVWSTLSKTNFDRLVDLWDNPKLLDEPAYFGWLSNSINLYPETLNLKTNVHSRNIGERPYLVLEPTDHPLSIEQRSGMMPQRVREIAERSLHR